MKNRFTTEDIVRAADIGLLRKGQRPQHIRAYFDHRMREHQSHRKAMHETAEAFGVTEAAVKKARQA